MAKIKISVESKILEGPNEILVYIPKRILEDMRRKETEEDKATETAGSSYKIVYLLHGKNGSAESFFEETNLIRHADAYGIIAIATSVRNSFYTNMVYGERYFDYLSTEVPEALEALLKIKAEPEDTHVLGYSMGGFGALKMGLTFPKRFRGVASLSGSLRSMKDNLAKIDSEGRRDLFLAFGDCLGKVFEENDIYYLTEKLKNDDQATPEIYLYCGRKDGLLEINRRYHRYLSDKGIRHTYVEDEGGHEYWSWDEQIREYFKRIRNNEVYYAK